MKKIIFLFLFNAFLLTGLAAYPLELTITGSKISVHADKEPLKNILQTLVNQGITVHADPEINPSVTVSFNNRKIEQGLKILFRDINHVLIWNTIDTPAGQFVRLKEIFLFLPGRKAHTITLSPNTGRLAQNPHNGSTYIKNEILVRLSKEIDLADFKKFLIENGLTVSGYNKIAGTIKIILPEKSDYFAILELINEYPGIEKAEPNYAYHINQTFFNPGFSGITHEYNANHSSENNVRIAVIDSGLSSEYQSAPYIYAYFDCLDSDGSLSDSLGHGTHMAMIAGGAVTPIGTGDDSGYFNPVIVIKGFDEEGYISNFDLMNGIEFAMNNDARIMSLSWGSETSSEFLEQSFDYAASKGMIILGAAGNEATGTNMYPAAYNSVIGVGALDPQGKKWEKSNYGDFVTVYAPGFASLPVGNNGKPGTYAGTSISTAYAANLIAGYFSKNPDSTIKEVLKALSNNSEGKKK